MTLPSDLTSASDTDLDQIVRYASPIVLRGLLYQLTGDEAIAGTPVEPVSTGVFTAMGVTDRLAVDVLRSRAASFLKGVRDERRNSWALDEGRLSRSIALTAGEDIPQEDIELWVEELGLNPFARGVDARPELEGGSPSDFRVLVIGAGMMGINAGVQLKNAGISFEIVDKNADPGGTWFENRYPGCRVDTPSRAYTLICGTQYTHPYMFNPRKENQRYLEWIVGEYGLRRYMALSTEVTSLVWDEESQEWEVRAQGPEGAKVWRVNAVITAVGLLNRPNIPVLDGSEEFAGAIFHSANWPSNFQVDGKRIAVIGSGCSGYQMFPEIARTAGHTYLFQRTPSWVFETSRYLSKLPPEVNWLERNFPYYQNFTRLRFRWLHGPAIQGRVFDRDPAVSERVRSQRLEFMQEKLGTRPDLLQRMLPCYPPHASRPVLVDREYGVYDALLADNTSLVTSPISRITSSSILDASGEEHPVDAIVLATGFRANDFLSPMHVVGRNGATTEALWAGDGARAYLGTMLPGFPNFFMVYGPNTNPVSGAGNPAIHEMVTRFIIQNLVHLVNTDARTIEPTSEGYRIYNEELDAAERTKVYVGSGVRNYYNNEHGRSATNSPFDARKVWSWLRDPSGKYRSDAATRKHTAGSAVAPYFGNDLVVR